MESGRRRQLLFLRVAAWVVVAACVVLFARRLQWDAVFAALGRADLRLAVAAALVSVPGLLLQGLRWSALVNAVRPVPRAIPISALFVGQAASAFLPLRAGEVVRTELLARSSGLGRATSLGTVALDHTVNGIAMFALAALLPLLLPVPRWMAGIVWGGVLGVALLAVLMLRLSRAPGAHVGGRLRQVFVRARSGLAALRNFRAVAPAFLFSLGAWGCEIGVVALTLAAFHLPHDVPHAMGVLFGVNLALGIPSPPASLGNFELGAGMALVAFGGAREDAAAFALGLHAVQLVPTLLAGGFLLGRFRRPALRAGLREAAHAE